MGQLRFDDQVAVITGAGRGIGRAHALMLAGRGAKVVVNDLGVQTDGTGSSAGPAESVVAEIQEADGIAIPDTHSVAVEEGTRAVVDTALRAFGRIDVLIHNAGFVWADMDALLDVHLRAAAWLTEAAWPAMRQQEYGRIVLTTSNAGLYGMSLGPDYTSFQSYGAAKMGVVGLVRALALRGRSLDIKVNALAPGAATRLGDNRPGQGAEAMSGIADDPRLAGALRGETPARPPALVAAAAAWLVHRDCPVSGEIYGAAAGTMTRIFIAETPGYSHPELSPELVRDNFDQIRNEQGYVVPTDLMECPHVQAMITAKAP